ncbi:MAG: hypothetical protein HN742_26470 [Lentisphaerae bacterium]|jgi:hypothetical protein|nr:hypothetical protein [Lentisphaerota bacterium]MBT4818516.1 hypothetical protein [Lentisphaerota bacterium]MBT5606008.1 hypothetical protein [Lentisphaerota bacterium]MBT7058603.1 hypothetical protein [Lentisphaerota bacterium]MBT7845447.1 hypothetical protein [Lentisphaerota bacterium]
MNATLSGLLRSLEAIPDDVQRCVDKALNGFVVASGRITDWDAYCGLLAAFYARLESAVLGINPPRKPNMEFDFSRCVRLMERTMYGESAMQAGFEVARTGTEGGVRQLLGRLAAAYGQTSASDQARALVSLYWEKRTHPQLFSDMDEYIAAYGHMLPSEALEGNAPRIRGKFWEALAAHPVVMRSPLRAVR